MTSQTVPHESAAAPPRPLFIAVYAGICSAFGFLMWRSVVEFLSKGPGEIFDVVLAIVIVALGVVMFIEPWIERLKRVFGLPKGHADSGRGNRLMLMIGGLLVVALASVSHGLLASLVEHDSSGAFGIVVAAILLPGGVTYAWLRGGRLRPRRATLSGLAAGGAIGICFGFLAVFLSIDRTAVSLNQAEIWLMESVVTWPLFGLLGGVAIDKGWGRSPAYTVPIVVLGAALVLTTISDGWNMAGFDDLSKICGWMIGLVLQRSAIDRCLGVGVPTTS